MSMFSEIHAEQTAKKLEEILLDVIDDYSDVKSAVMGFSKKHLYDWYLEECENYFSHGPNQRIVKAFKEKYGIIL